MLAQAIRKKLGKAGKEEKGFTLIELLAVIVILGIIAVIAIPMIGNIIGDTKNKSDLATARQVYDASRIYVTSEMSGQASNGTIDIIGTKGTSTTKGTGLQGLGYLEDDIMLPSTKTEIDGGTVNYQDGVLANAAADTTNNIPAAAVVLKAGSVTKYFTKEQIMKTELK